MIELSLNKIGMYYGANEIVNDINFQLHSNERIGLIGKNGTGKTTVFKLIAALEDPYSGEIFKSKGSSVGYLHQIPDYKDITVIDVIKMGLGEVNTVQSELKKYEDKLAVVSDDYEKVLDQYGKLQHKFEQLGGYEVEERIGRIITGFKFTEDFLQMDFDLLSGGEKTKVMLGKILLESPSILLLDEPTNHLDIDTVEWLEAFMKDYKGSVIIVSHDRYFLDNVVTRIIEIENKKSIEYMGNYSYYVEEKERRLLQQIKLYEAQQKKIKSMEEAIKRFRDWGTRSDNEAMFVKAKSMEKRIDKLDKVERPQTNDKKIALGFELGSRSGKEVIFLDKVAKSFGDNQVLKEANMKLFYKDKVALLGRNGSGKSTIINMVLDKFQPTAGDLKVGASVKIGYLEQEIDFEDENKSIVQSFVEFATITEEEARRKLARFLFYGDDVFKELKNLSGGEKARYRLCQLMEQEVNLLLLDEPTNHVDIDSREMIEQALASFEGTILFISHDRYFIKKIAAKVFEVEDGYVNKYDGDYDYYKREIEKKQQKERMKLISESASKQKKQYKKNQVTDETKLKKKLDKLIGTLEVEISALENSIRELEVKMGEPSVGIQDLISMQKALDDNKRNLESKMEAWMDIVN